MGAHQGLRTKECYLEDLSVQEEYEWFEDLAIDPKRLYWIIWMSRGWGGGGC